MLTNSSKKFFSTPLTTLGGIDTIVIAADVIFIVALVGCIIWLCFRKGKNSTKKVETDEEFQAGVVKIGASQNEFDGHLSYSSQDDDEVGDYIPPHACKYCGLSDPSSVAQCTICGKWFCNGKGKTAGSHIINHIVRAGHREIALHKDGPLSETQLECYHYGSRNIFLLGFIPSKTNSVNMILCQHCSLQNTLKNEGWSADDWRPLIDEYQINPLLINIPPQEEQLRARQITAMLINRLEELWNNNPEATTDDLERPGKSASDPELNLRTSPPKPKPLTSQSMPELRNVNSTFGFKMKEFGIGQYSGIFSAPVQQGPSQQFQDPQGVIPLSPHEKGTASVHEACHIFVAMTLGMPVKKATLKRCGSMLGHTLLNDATKLIWTEKELEKKIMIFLAGYVGEKLICKSVSDGVASDIIQATIIVYLMFCEYGMNKNLGLMYHNLANCSQKLKEKIESEANQKLSELLREVTKIVEGSVPKIIMLAEFLADKDELDEDAIKTFFETHNKE